MHEEIMSQAIKYFRERKIYRQLFEKVREKYSSLGHFGGQVKINKIDDEDKKDLGGFFQKDYTENKSITISFNQMEKSLEKSKFKSLSWKDIIENYFGEQLTVKKDEREKQEVQRKKFFHKIKREFAKGEDENNCEKILSWMDYILKDKGEGYNSIIQQYNISKKELYTNLLKTLKAFLELPDMKKSQKKELISVFAAKTTSNPHFFDDNSFGEIMLVSFLQYNYGIEYKNKNMIFSDTEKIVKNITKPQYKAKLFENAKILKDDLSNDVLIYNIHAVYPDGKIHEGIEGFNKNKEPLKITMYTISNLKEIFSKDKNIYIIENPSVFSILSSKYSDKSFICSNGQIRRAVFSLLDIISKDNTLYYCGDYDPEGLLIAQNLKLRYKENLFLWNYTEQIYKSHLYDKQISETRLKKLDNIKIKELLKIRDEMKIFKKPAYQESFISYFKI